MLATSLYTRIWYRKRNSRSFPYLKGNDILMRLPWPLPPVESAELLKSQPQEALFTSWRRPKTLVLSTFFASHSSQLALLRRKGAKLASKSPQLNTSLTWVRRKNEVSYPWRMFFIECCKGQSAFGNACTVGASISKSTLAVVWLPQKLSAGVILTSNSRYHNVSSM